mmetsp:Transcript_54319/g.116732  ORF Transcript_54319/g.116732 Transcript_54319/m.116732 type:complete len:224 (-) Transcript_54319:1026-1697(-)
MRRGPVHQVPPLQRARHQRLRVGSSVGEAGLGSASRSLVALSEMAPASTFEIALDPRVSSSSGARTERCAGRRTHGFALTSSITRPGAALVSSFGRVWVGTQTRSSTCPRQARARSDGGTTRTCVSQSLMALGTSGLALTFARLQRTTSSTSQSTRRGFQCQTPPLRFLPSLQSRYRHHFGNLWTSTLLLPPSLVGQLLQHNPRDVSGSLMVVRRPCGSPTAP